MENYFYLIAVVLIGLISSFAKTKKIHAKSKPKTTKSSWEEVLRELIPIEQEEEIIQKMSPVVPKVSTNQYDGTEGAGTEGVAVIHKIKEVAQKHTQQIPKKQLITQDMSLHTANDARKAFLYSEIFNRKYFTIQNMI